MTPALVLLLSTCELGDHACRAKDYVARAHEQGIAHNLKVQRLYLAHVEHLSDFDVRRDPRVLPAPRTPGGYFASGEGDVLTLAPPQL